ncbi:MAG TPA: hypothetical protein VJU86_14280 [Pyrinomonadaceae bacterium]|nr:hypothetical protein [Pyrinomonadaceae bacterium]
MLTETFQSIATATRTVFRSWRSMLLIAMVYALLLAALYSFIAVREASVAQVVITFALAIAAPILFFILQAMIMGGIARDETSASLGSIVKTSLANFWKLLLITLPLIALAVLVAYLLAKAQARLGSSIPETTAEIPRRLADGARDTSKPIDWRAALVSTVRYLTFGLFLPIAAIHLWLAAASEGLGHALKRIGNLLAKAFAPQSVLIYVVGFIVFAVVPYLLLFRSIPSKHAWLEITLLTARLAVIFALTLFGWVITVKALAHWSRKNSRSAAGSEAV